MSIKEYADDMSLTVDEILKHLNKLGIDKKTEDEILSNDEITLLDNELANVESVKDTEEIEELEEQYELEDKAEELASAFVKEEKAKVVVKPKKEGPSNLKKSFETEKKNLYKKREKLQANDTKDDSVVYYEDGMSVNDLAKALDVVATELIKKLFNLGIVANMNTSLAFDVAEMLVVDYSKELLEQQTADLANFEEYIIHDKEEDLTKRAPIVTIMGHVDHGKTSLLDYIRKSDVLDTEAGGITQNIGAYQVTHNNNKLTFIDTPGHEAFTSMRARGASVTDIIIIVVAADDGIKVQTKEAIEHAKLANVPVIVAINKIDKPNINIDKVYSELADNGLNPDEWGGDTVVIKISALTGEGIDKLLDTIVLISEMSELKANEKRYATGTVLETKLDRHVGSTVSVIVGSGTLRLGDPIVVGTEYGKVRSLKNDKGQNLSEAGPSTPVEITGLTKLPQAGDKFMAFETEKQARTIANERKLRSRKSATNKAGLTLEELFGNVTDSSKRIDIILKTNVKGSEEAIKSSLSKIKVEDIKLNLIRSGVGEVTEADVLLANTSKALIIAFDVNVAQTVNDIAKEQGIEIKKYDIIYKLIEDLESIMKDILEPIYTEKETGRAEIRQIFTFSKVGNIAGCNVLTGTIKNNQNIHVMRKDEVIHTGKIRSIQREKDQVKEVTKGMDCGITLLDFYDIKESDIIVAFDLVEQKR